MGAAAAHAFDAPRHYLFTSADEPLAAAAVWAWEEGPPDLCITSPSREARETAAFACAGHFVDVIEEAQLARRAPHESVDDFADRYAKALLIVYAYDTRSALVVCDELPAGWPTPFLADGDGILRRSALLERAVPLP